MDEPRIDIPTAGVMVIFAGLIDFAQFVVSLMAFIPVIGLVFPVVINPVLDAIAGIVFGIWFSHFGISIFESKRALGLLFTILMEAVPGFDALPWWTVFVIFTVWRERHPKTEI